MKPGYSQNESDLVISISATDKPTPEDTKSVAWYGRIQDENSSCHHGGTISCTHCAGGHTGGCSHCSSHKGAKLGGDFMAPELNYDKTVEQLINYKDLIIELSNEGYGISLLHGHSQKHMFTKLPENYVSVISNNETSFRKLSNVKKDLNFIPNMWRIKNGTAIIAGGFTN